MTTLTFQSFQDFPCHHYDMPPSKIKKKKIGKKDSTDVAHTLTGGRMAKFPVTSPFKKPKSYPKQIRQKL